MEKLVYILWHDDWSENLTQRLSSAVAELSDVSNAQLNVPDVNFQGGQAPIRNLLPRFDGAVSLWLESRLKRSAVENLLRKLNFGFHGYAVCESTPMTQSVPEPRPNGKVEVLSQMCLLQRPDELPLESWLSHWLDKHTDVAIVCQTTISYVQNIVQAPVTAKAPAIHGIVEECFPIGAYDDLQLFFGSPGDPERMAQNITRLMESTASFAPVDRLDRIFTAPYRCARAQHETHPMTAKRQTL